MKIILHFHLIIVDIVIIRSYFALRLKDRDYYFKVTNDLAKLNLLINKFWVVIVINLLMFNNVIFISSYMKVLFLNGLLLEVHMNHLIYFMTWYYYKTNEIKLNIYILDKDNNQK